MLACFHRRWWRIVTQEMKCSKSLRALVHALYWLPLHTNIKCFAPTGGGGRPSSGAPPLGEGCPDTPCEKPRHTGSCWAEGAWGWPRWSGE